MHQLSYECWLANISNVETTHSARCSCAPLAGVIAQLMQLHSIGRFPAAANALLFIFDQKLRAHALLLRGFWQQLLLTMPACT
jgi:hypothetical protein